MQGLRFQIAKIVWTLGALGALTLCCFSTAQAQGPEAPPKPVGWEVKSTNTPGGKGELVSQGVTGKKTPYAKAKAAPSTAGSAVINILIVYYDSKEDLDKANELEKKEKEEAKKKKAEKTTQSGATAVPDGGKKDGGKGDGQPQPPKKGDGKKDPAKQPEPPPVITFDPRTHELKDGKVVPKVPKQDSLKMEDHKFCETPDRFECGEHFQWWLKTHEHRNAPKTIDSEMKPMDLNGQPRIIMSGSVVAGQDAMIRVVDPRGAFLSGVVVSMPDGTQATTDAEGKATVKAPNDSDKLVLTLVGLGVAANAWIRPYGEGNAIPRIDPPSFIQPGQEATFGWTNGGANSVIQIDGKPVEILASSPTGCVARIPQDLAPGTHTVAFSSGQGRDILSEEIAMSVDDVRPVESISLAVEPPKTLVVGQKAVYTVRVMGTDRKLDLTLANLNPSVATLSGKAATNFVSTSGGKDNRARIEVQSASMGQIMIAVQIAKSSTIDPAPSGSR